MASESNDAEGLSPGQLVAGKYRILRKLGSGGMCDVFEAEHIELRQPVALKALKPELARDQEAVARFTREARAAAKLRSHNVAKVFDVDTRDSRQPFITMELLVGHDLGTELAQKGSIPFGLAVDYVRQAAAGMAEAHALGIVHRDLKPENLFLTDLGAYTDRKLIKILDFGIAKHLDEGDRRLTAPDAVFGTVDYMSPEQIRSASSVDHRSDIWSLGVILFELLTGRAPFTGDARAVIAQIVSDPVPIVTQLLPSLPPEFAAVIMKCLEKNPADRFQSADELRASLAPYAEAIEPITSVIGRLPPLSMPRRNVEIAPGDLRDVRTNLSFETQGVLRPRRRWLAPTLGAFVVGAFVFAFLNVNRFRRADGGTTSTSRAPAAGAAAPPLVVTAATPTVEPSATPSAQAAAPPIAKPAARHHRPTAPPATPVRSSTPSPTPPLPKRL